MHSITLPAPAKVNLLLKVLKKRRDGYHDLYTVFEKISLADEIKISAIPHGIKVLSDRVITRSPADNIAYKAASLLIKEFGIRSGVEIRIKKRIPIAAGLGGGSSDAASVLMGMGSLFDLNIGAKELGRLALKLGADVPFFVSGSAFAIGEGVGERLKPIAIRRRLYHLVVFPGFGIPTREVYGALDRLDFALTPKNGDARIHPSYFSRATDFGLLETMLYNDLQRAAISRKSVLGSIIERLTSSTGRRFILSGSGPSVFCLYRTRKEAVSGRARIYRTIPAKARKRWQVFIAQTQI